MAKGNYHEMPAIVRVEIHDDETCLPARHDQMKVIVVGLMRLTEYTILLVVSGLRECLNVFGAPGGKQSFHVRIALQGSNE
jgi:hypothetical protein